MDKAYIENEVQRIKDCAEDIEMANALEYKLYFDFVAWLCKGNRKIDEEVGELAKLILSTKDIKFSRW